jgi:hypothetical protein
VGRIQIDVDVISAVDTILGFSMQAEHQITQHQW